jgi:large subunit ribosomal protein L15
MEKKIVRKKVTLASSVAKKAHAAAAAAKAPSPDTSKVPVFGLHSLQVPQGAHKKKKLLGRGSSSGHGKTSTRGSKGQTSRAGRHMYAGFEGGQTPLIRRMPKRGFTSMAAKRVVQIVNVGELKRVKGTQVNPATLAESRIIKDADRPVKILGTGEIAKALTVSAHYFSKQAQQKLKAAGCTLEVLNV